VGKIKTLQNKLLFYTYNFKKYSLVVDN